MIDDIRYVLGNDELLDAWLSLDVKVYYRGLEPFGLIGTRLNDGILYIASTGIVKYDSFSFSMFRDILMLHKHHEICILFEDNGTNTRQIASVLSRYGGYFKHLDTHVCWFNNKDGKHDETS